MSHLKVHHIGGNSCWYFDLYSSHKYLKVPEHSLIRLSAVINNNPYLIFICFEFDKNAVISMMIDMYEQNDKLISRCELNNSGWQLIPQDGQQWDVYNILMKSTCWCVFCGEYYETAPTYDVFAAHIESHFAHT